MCTCMCAADEQGYMQCTECVISLCAVVKAALPSAAFVQHQGMLGLCSIDCMSRLACAIYLLLFTGLG